MITMYISKLLERKCVFLILLINLILANCFNANANDHLIYTRGKILNGYVNYEDVITKYGDIWISYTASNEKIRTTSGKERFIIYKANYFYKMDDAYFLLGFVDANGVYDKNGVCLKNASEIPIANNLHIVGLSSKLVDENILNPTFILKSTTIDNFWLEPDSFAFIDIDTQQDTLRLFPSPF